MKLAADAVKACCADAYSGPAARFLLGDSFHPGGRDLTRRLLRSLELGPSSRLVDVASGTGASAILAAEELGCSVVGVDLSVENVAAASHAAGEAGLGGQVRFVPGDAESLPLETASVDGALCECSLCLFPDKDAAAAELARVLRPGGRLACSDVTADTGRLPAALAGLGGWVACVADARPVSEVVRIVEGAGFAVERRERHDGLLAALVDRVESRLELARLAAPLLGADAAAGVERASELVPAVREAIATGALGYFSLVARRA